MTDSGPAQYKLTIGELFPADDLVSQWMFTLTSVAEDLTILISKVNTAALEDQFREQMLFYRLLITRLLEARRLVLAWQKHPEIQAFTGGRLAFGDLDLASVYTKGDGGARSLVEKLLLDSRNRTTHYSEIGEPELAGLLRDYQRFPARMVMSEAAGGTSAEYQWVSAIRFQDTIGAPPWAPDMIQHLNGFGRSVGSLVQAWTMLCSVCLILYARRRGIPLERIIDEPDKLNAMVMRQRPG